MSDRQTSTFRTLASHNTTKQASWSPGYYYDDRHLLEQLQACSSLLSTVAQRMSEKNVIIHNLQENSNRERNAMLYEISTLKWQLAVEKQNMKIAAQKREISHGAEEEEACRDGGAETTKPEVEPEQAEEWRLESLEAERHKLALFLTNDMAEAAGLVVGVVALAGLFNNTVECFEFVQLGRTFGKDFQTSQLKLDSARLRLSRWGKSLSLDSNVPDTVSLQGRVGSEANVKHAEALLGQIVELFAEAEGVSSRYRGRTEPQDGSLAVYDPQTDLDPAMAKLHEKMRQLAIERQNRSGVRQKARWALYQEKQFRRLIEDITELVNDLDNLFPATQQSQRELCDIEVSAIGEDQDISVLREIAAAQDKLLEQAITKAAESAGKSHHIVFSGSGNTGLQLGHNSGTMSGFTFGRGS
ncbi:uncharacterized protein ALTATR162_LOCUS448 [Alternaria atra]|uniref:Prion-inhibition and propagation HeLo domain-containing protein n=1 Tax=Alternaria atra TaxID=119953 RepID=A0A8J2MW22_9PLEO|nr:uncharacterized protein ALTATR162_LOCUS448 [Alternaria atra]CAG5138832.1 unnamed protein product [Alternaria atra]